MKFLRIEDSKGQSMFVNLEAITYVQFAANSDNVLVHFQAGGHEDGMAANYLMLEGAGAIALMNELSIMAAYPQMEP